MCYFDSYDRELCNDARCVENGGHDVEVLTMQACGFANFTLFSNSWLVMGTLQSRLGYFSVVVWTPHVSNSDALICCEFVRLEAFCVRAGPLL
jgi:hypothetical protein